MPLRAESSAIVVIARNGERDNGLWGGRASSKFAAKVAAPASPLLTENAMAACVV